MEMTSKEALERLNNFISREKHINSERNKIVNECLNTIKQDLERLAQLEKDLIEEREHSLEQAYKILELEDKIERSENANILVLYEKENQNLKEDLRLTTIERTNCEDRFYKEHLKCCELEKENQDFRYIFKAIKELGELHLEKQVNGEFTYYAIIIGDFCILIEEEQYKLLKEVIKNGRDNKISD